MRDDFQVPNLGEAPASYDVSFFSRMVRNVEMTFTTMRAIGKMRATYLTLKPVKVDTLASVAAEPGMVAMTSDGRKNGEGPGAGTGVLVFYDGVAWRACDTGQTVSA